MLGEPLVSSILFSCLTEWRKDPDSVLLSRDYGSIIMTLHNDPSHGCYETMQTVG